jgi:hypothetical protein
VENGTKKTSQRRRGVDTGRKSLSGRNSFIITPFLRGGRRGADCGNKMSPISDAHEGHISLTYPVRCVCLASNIVKGNPYLSR